MQILRVVECTIQILHIDFFASKIHLQAYHAFSDMQSRTVALALSNSSRYFLFAVCNTFNTNYWRIAIYLLSNRFCTSECYFTLKTKL